MCVFQLNCMFNYILPSLIFPILHVVFPMLNTSCDNYPYHTGVKLNHMIKVWDLASC